jgi:putative endonuclease
MGTSTASKTEHSAELGAAGEEAAANFLRIRGYQIIARNFKTPIGRNRKGVAITGEIDIIALKDSVICFVEVKTRAAINSTPEDQVTLQKQRQITRTVRTYQKLFSLDGQEIRFDVISIIDHGNKAPRIKHFKRFWNPEKFRKKIWSGDTWFQN